MRIKRLLCAISLLVLGCAAKVVAAQPGDLLLHGAVRGDQNTAYLLVPFQVPSGTERLTVDFSYTGKEEKTTVDLGVEDPERFRGWSGGNKSQFTISATDATPSYLAGPIPAGQWKLILGVAHIRPGGTATYTATIHFKSVSDTGTDSFTSVPLSREARWYRGDLHLHTAHSDGSCTSQAGLSVPCPLFVSVEEAVRHHLDFLAITDHNTTSHYDDERELQPYFDNLLLIPGRELTTYSGHANIWGTTSFVDFRAGGKLSADKNSVLAQAQAAGAVVSINHPIGPAAELCIGCAWDDTLADIDMRLVQAIEVINGPANSPGAYYRAGDIAFWESQLRRGFHITAVGGSDTHQPELDTIGLPTTVVFASELSVASILDAIRAGHVFVDLTGSRNLPKDQPRIVELSASVAAGKSVMMGDALRVAAGVTVSITTRVTGSLGSALTLLVDGSPDAQLATVTVTSQDQTHTSTWSPQLAPGRPHWLRTEVRAPDGSLLLLTNPIYLN